MSNWSQSSSSSSDPHSTEDSVSTSTPAGFCLSFRWLTKTNWHESPEVSAGVEQAVRAQEKHERISKEGQQPYWSPSMRLPYHKQMSPARSHSYAPQYTDRLYAPCESPEPGRRGAAHQQGPLCC